MITKKKLKDLRKRMLAHGVAGGVAVVVLTAKEVQELIETAEELITLKQQVWLARNLP